MEMRSISKIVGVVLVCGVIVYFLPRVYQRFAKEQDDQHKRVLGLVEKGDDRRRDTVESLGDGVTSPPLTDGPVAPVAVLEPTFRASEGVSVATLSRDGTRVGGLTRDGTLKVWFLDRGGESRVLDASVGRVYELAFSADGGKIAAACKDQTVRLLSVEGEATPRVLRGHEKRVTSVRFSPDDTRLASTAWDGTVRIWTVDGSGEPEVLMAPHPGFLEGVDGAVKLDSVAFSPEGSFVVASLPQSCSSYVWSMADGGEAHVLDHSDPTSVCDTVEFSVDGTRILTPNHYGGEYAWAVGAPFEPLPTHDMPAGYVEEPDPWYGRTNDKKYRVSSSAISSDGSLRIDGLVDGSARVWTADWRKRIATYDGHSGEVSRVGIAPGNRFAVTASEAGKVRAWSGSHAYSLQGPGDPGSVRQILFSADGSRLLVRYSTDVFVYSLPESTDPLVAGS